MLGTGGPELEVLPILTDPELVQLRQNSGSVAIYYTTYNIDLTLVCYFLSRARTQLYQIQLTSLFGRKCVLSPPQALLHHGKVTIAFSSQIATYP